MIRRRRARRRAAAPSGVSCLALALMTQHRCPGMDGAPPVLRLRMRLRQPRRVSNGPDVDRRCGNMATDGLQPLQDGLPLLPIQLPEERPQPLNEWIFQQSFAIRLRDEEAVEADA